MRRGQFAQRTGDRPNERQRRWIRRPGPSIVPNPRHYEPELIFADAEVEHLTEYADIEDLGSPGASGMQAVWWWTWKATEFASSILHREASSCGKAATR